MPVLDRDSIFLDLQTIIKSNAKGLAEKRQKMDKIISNEMANISV